MSAAPRQTRLIRTAREVNDARPGSVVDAVAAAVGTMVDPVIACLGLAFKANVDDLRESPAVAITRSVALRLPGASVLAAEPHIGKLPSVLDDIPNLAFECAADAVAKADVVVLLVDHNQFHTITRADLGGKRVVDTRGFFR